jgi:hypothetical protein
MAGYLKQELAVPPLVQQLARERFLHWQTSENEWPRSEPQILVRVLPLKANAGNRLRPPNPLLRDNQLAGHLAQDVPCGT